PARGQCPDPHPGRARRLRHRGGAHRQCRADLDHRGQPAHRRRGPHPPRSRRGGPQGDGGRAAQDPRLGQRPIPQPSIDAIVTLPARPSLDLPLALALLALLAACAPEPPAEAPPPPVEAPPPPERPEPPPVDQAALRRERAESARAATARAEAAAASPASRNMREYLANVEETLISRGRLRTDGGTEITLTPEKLAEDFIEVALHDEYIREGGKLIPRATPAPLRRWQQPVLVRVEFGDSVAPALRARDRADIAGLAARLQSVSGHQIGRAHV